MRIFVFASSDLLQECDGGLFGNCMSKYIGGTETGTENKILRFPRILAIECLSLYIQKLPIRHMRTIRNNLPPIQRIYPGLVHRIDRGNLILLNNSPTTLLPIQNNKQIINSHNGLDLLIIKLPNQMPQKLPIHILWRMIIK